MNAFASTLASFGVVFLFALLWIGEPAIAAKKPQKMLVILDDLLCGKQYPPAEVILSRKKGHKVLKFPDYRVELDVPIGFILSRPKGSRGCEYTAYGPENSDGSRPEVSILIVSGADGILGYADAYNSLNEFLLYGYRQTLGVFQQGAEPSLKAGGRTFDSVNFSGAFRNGQTIRCFLHTLPLESSICIIKGSDNGPGYELSRNTLRSIANSIRINKTTHR